MHVARLNELTPLVRAPATRYQMATAPIAKLAVEGEYDTYKTGPVGDYMLNHVWFLAKLFWRLCQSDVTPKLKPLSNTYIFRLNVDTSVLARIYDQTSTTWPRKHGRR